MSPEEHSDSADWAGHRQNQITAALRGLEPAVRIIALREIETAFCMSCGYERRPGEVLCPCTKVDA